VKKDFHHHDGPGKNIGAEPIAGSGNLLVRLKQVRTFASLRIPAYRFYWAAVLCQMAAMNMQMLARSSLIFKLTGSTMMLGLMGVFNALPMLVLSLFGGIIADRVQKKYVMLAGQTGSALVSLAIALSLTAGYLSTEHAGSWWVLAVAAVFQGTIMGLMMPSRQAYLPEIVGQEQLLNAISLSNVGMSAMRLLAPAIAGFLIGDSYNYAVVYYTMTGLYVLAVVLVFFLPKGGMIAVRGSGALADIREGLRYLRGETTLLLLMLITLVAVVLSMPFGMLMPAFTEGILGVGPTGLGVIMSVSGAGAIVGSLTFASLPNKKRGLLYLISCLTMGLALVAFAASTTWTLSLGIIVIVGLGQTGFMTLSNTLIQYYVDDRYRGRVMSILMMQFGLTSFGTFLAGLLSESLGVQWVIGGFAAILVVLSLFALVFIPRIRRLD
jgi:MFS family permease